MQSKTISEVTNVKVIQFQGLIHEYFLFNPISSLHPIFASRRLQYWSKDDDITCKPSMVRTVRGFLYCLKLLLVGNMQIAQKLEEVKLG